MGVAYNAGANLRDNAQQLDFGQIVGNAARGALGATVDAISPVARPLASGMQDFFHGLTTGHALGQAAATPAPASTAKAQAKPTAIGGKFIELPGVGRVQMPSEAWLHDHPAQNVDTSSASKAAAKGGGAAKASNPFYEAVARFASAEGGISLNELSALSRSAAETSMLRTQPKDPSSKDVAGLELKGMADQLFTGKMSQAQALKAKDPAGAAKLQDEAVKERMDTLKAILGANPVDLQTAAAMDGTGTIP